MNQVVVGISDLRVSGDRDDELVTFALGSCIGVTAWDPVRRVGGLLHYLLPSGATSPEKARDNPLMFGDLGIPLLFESLYRFGCTKRTLVVTVAGGASIGGAEGVLNVGKRNYTLLRKLFWKNGVMIAAEDVGGVLSRTVRLQVGTGRVSMKIQGEETVLWEPSPVHMLGTEVGR